MNIFQLSLLVTILILISITIIQNNTIKRSIYIFLIIFASFYFLMENEKKINAIEGGNENVYEVFDEIEDNKIYNQHLSTPIEINKSELVIDNIPLLNI
jgi:hypothetical protein